MKRFLSSYHCTFCFALVDSRAARHKSQWTSERGPLSPTKAPVRERSVARLSRSSWRFDRRSTSFKGSEKELDMLWDTDMTRAKGLGQATSVWICLRNLEKDTASPFVRLQAKRKRFWKITRKKKKKSSSSPKRETLSTRRTPRAPDDAHPTSPVSGGPISRTSAAAQPTQRLPF